MDDRNGRQAEGGNCHATPSGNGREASRAVSSAPTGGLSFLLPVVVDERQPANQLPQVPTRLRLVLWVSILFTVENLQVAPPTRPCQNSWSGNHRI
jgi:hypothetical protein